MNFGIDNNDNNDDCGLTQSAAPGNTGVKLTYQRNYKSVQIVQTR